ncbi:FUSC family protein [Oleiagrimonas soli]|uniref:Putative membrane protein YccC n=1 Tax=Oleiagrimonas soli TaxID=1543381 RepID=A0A099CWB8_9GAMM|nr:FUSC family protein [Oleiagrimonas soli]KGI77951.1 hypothetical protein LF63_0106060 [Oleiagrimonas soli]MBB6183674.1 putative membrane protein YccC [Oleiagrimonas soli]
MRRHRSTAALTRTFGLLAAELRTLHWRGPRALLAAQTVASVLLAVSLADLFRLTDRWWVAISAYVVMRADWSTSWRRGVQRMAGTIGGAVACLLLAYGTRGSTTGFVLLLALIAGVGVYMALGSTRSYGWLLATITACLILAEANTQHALWHIALLRVADVAVGTTACILIAGLVHLLRPHWHLPLLDAERDEPSPADPHTPQARRRRAWQALPAACSVGILATAHALYPMPAFPQMLVTVVVLPMIPLRTLLQRDFGEAAVGLRMANRLLGCLLAALLALALLPWAGGHPVLFLPALAVGVWLASHIHSGHEDTRYIGLQFGIAFLMVFVQDHAWTGELRPALMRLAGILGGVLMLAVLRLALARARRSWLARR